MRYLAIIHWYKRKAVDKHKGGGVCNVEVCCATPAVIYRVKMIINTRAKHLVERVVPNYNCENPKTSKVYTTAGARVHGTSRTREQNDDA